MDVMPLADAAKAHESMEHGAVKRGSCCNSNSFLVFRRPCVDLDSRGLQTQAAYQLGEAIAQSVEDSFRTPALIRKPAA